jgi:hypothetical protein
METVRRWYVYLVCAVTLQASVWALINLLRRALVPNVGASLATVAFQISVLVIGVPVFLVHWRMMRRGLADPEERESVPWLLYYYGMVVGFLIPLTTSVLYLVENLLRLAFDVSQRSSPYYTPLPPAERALLYLISAVVLAVICMGHWRLGIFGGGQKPEGETHIAVRQAAYFILAGIGLTMAALGAINVLYWLTRTLIPPSGQTDMYGKLFLANNLARLIASLPLWFAYWRAAQRLAARGEPAERSSPVRQSYLQLAVFAAVLTVVVTVALLLADVFRALLGLTVEGDIRWPVSIVLVAGPLWFYHSTVLKKDAVQAVEVEQEAVIRQTYWYLTAAIGLAAVLVGVGGDLTALIRTLGSRPGLTASFREQLAVFTALVTVGFPLWYINWRRAQQAVHTLETEQSLERGSLVRRIYLYLFLFTATMVILGSAIYALSQVVELLLGARTAVNLLRDMAQAVAYLLLAGTVWLYHGPIVRSDSRLLKETEAAQAKPLKVAVVDPGDDRLGKALIAELGRKVPNIALHPVGSNPTAAEVMNGHTRELSPEEILAAADIIVGPWNMTLASAAEDNVQQSMAATIAGSQARKVLIPVWADGWAWAGVEKWKQETMVKDVTSAVRQLASGRPVRPKKRRSIAGIIVIVASVLLVIEIAIPLVLLLLFGLV